MMKITIFFFFTYNNIILLKKNITFKVIGMFPEDLRDNLFNYKPLLENSTDKFFRMLFSQDLREKLSNSKFLLENNVDKFNNYLEHSRWLQMFKPKTLNEICMPDHREASYDILHIILNDINSVIFLHYIATGLVTFLGVLIVRFMITHSNSPSTSTTTSYNCAEWVIFKKVQVHYVTKYVKSWFCNSFQLCSTKVKAISGVIGKKLTNFSAGLQSGLSALGEKAKDISIKSLGCLDMIRNLVPNYITVFTSHISNLGAGLSSGSGGGDKDGDKEDKRPDWMKYLEKMKIEKAQLKLRRQINSRLAELNRLIHRNTLAYQRAYDSLVKVNERIRGEIDWSKHKLRFNYQVDQDDFVRFDYNLRDFNQRSQALIQEMDQLAREFQDLKRELDDLNEKKL